MLGDANAAMDQKLLQNRQVKTIITAVSKFDSLHVAAEYTHIVFPLR